MDAECVARPALTVALSPSEVSDDQVSSLPLERCMRIVPHDQNSGAFYIAVFHKCSPFPVQEENAGVIGLLIHKDDGLTEAMTNKVNECANVLEAKSCDMIPGTHHVDKETYETSLNNEPVQTLEDDGTEDQQAPGDKEAGPENVRTKRILQIQGKWKGVDPVILFKDETVINSIKTFYGIDNSFPLYGHLVSRNSDTDSVKRIYYISKSVKDVLELNLLAGQQLKIASVGLKMFERQTSNDGNSSRCRYRISSEGLPLLLSYLTKQILFASLVDFIHLLRHKSIQFGNFVDAELGERASKLELGSCVVVLAEGCQSLSVPIQVDSSTIAIGCWKGRSNINVMVTELDCKDLLERLEMRAEVGDAQVTEPCNAGANEVAGKDDAGMKGEKAVNMVG